MNQIIEVKGLSKSFGKNKVLDDVSIGFAAQRIHGIIGRNGSGKTMLFKCILGMMPFSDGEITVNGKRVGKDITILTFGAVMYRALKAADELKEKYGMEAEVIDARSLVPFDYDTVLESVKKTGRLVIVTDACERGSFASEVARQITEMAFDYLDAAPTVVASRNWITPAHELEESFFPQPSWILDAIDAKIVPLKGHVRTTNQALNEKLRNERRGV